MIEVCNVYAYPLANSIRCALSVSKTGVVALSTGGLVSIPGMNLSPHELMGYLVNLSFKPVASLQTKHISLSPMDKTLRHIVNKIGIEPVNTDIIDLDTPILVVTDMVQFTIVVGTHTFSSPLDKDYVEDYAMRQGVDVDSLILSTFPLFQENTFPYVIDDIGGNKSRISFTNVPKSTVTDVFATLLNLSKM